MGSFAEIYKMEGACIPEEKIEEFEERLEKLFQASGMMDCEYISLFGIELMLIQKASMGDYGMNFTYNYFEDDAWENAGYNTEKHHVWSGKIGGWGFTMGVIGAYTLEELYIEGASLISYNGDWIFSDVMIGWINHLFDEKFIVKNRDVWKLCEMAHYKNEYMESDMRKGGIKYFLQLIQYADAALSQLEQVAVYDGISAVEAEPFIYKKRSPDSYFALFADLFKDMLAELREHKTDNAGESDIDDVLKLLEAFYGSDINEEEFLQMCKEKGFKSFGVFTSKFDLPVFAVKIEAENYDKDFWTLWDRIRNTINNSKRTFPELVDPPEPEEPISTKELFKISSDDDMIPYWTKDGTIHFSDDLENWFVELRNRYDILVESDINIVGNKLEWIMDLLDYATKEYCRIYAFGDFFYESLDNLSDHRYLALWKLFEELLHDPELQKAGAVIFEPDGKEPYNGTSRYYDGNGTRRRLSENWYFMSEEKKFNKARTTFRRYMALVANVDLREKVFGF